MTSLKALQAPFLFETDEHVAAVVNDAAHHQGAVQWVRGQRCNWPDAVPRVAPPPVQLRPADARPPPTSGTHDPSHRLTGHHGGDRGPRRHGRRPSRRRLSRRASPTRIDPGTRQRLHARQPGAAPSATSTATGNIALYAKVMTLVVNTALWTSLDDSRRAIITTASDATRAWAIANQTKDTDAAAKFCAAGGTVVLADAPRHRRLPCRRGSHLRRHRNRGHAP